MPIPSETMQHHAKSCHAKTMQNRAKQAILPGCPLACYGGCPLACYGGHMQVHNKTTLACSAQAKQHHRTASPHSIAAQHRRTASPHSIAAQHRRAASPRSIAASIPPSIPCRREASRETNTVPRGTPTRKPCKIMSCQNQANVMPCKNRAKRAITPARI